MIEWYDCIGLTGAGWFKSRHRYFAGVRKSYMLARRVLKYLPFDNKTHSGIIGGNWTTQQLSENSSIFPFRNGKWEHFLPLAHFSVRITNTDTWLPPFQLPQQKPEGWIENSYASPPFRLEKPLQLLSGHSIRFFTLNVMVSTLVKADWRNQVNR